jgi:hypothetical protein
VGAAVATGHGVAWANESDANSATSQHSVSEGSPNAVSPSSAPSTGQPTTQPTTQPASQPAQDSDTDTAASDEDDSSTETDVPDLDTDESATDVDPDAGADVDQKAGTDPSDEPTQKSDNAPTGPLAAAVTNPGSHNNTDNTGNTGNTANTPAAPDPTGGDLGTDASAAADVESPKSFRMAALTADESTDHSQSSSTTQDVVPMAFSTTETPETPAEQPALQRMIVNVLSSLSAGLSALASTLPGGPAWSPFVMAVLGLGSRREFTEPVSALARTVASVPVAALSMTDIAATALFPGTTRRPVAVSANTWAIEYLTGAGNLNNTTARFGIGGTDLGIMWDNGTTDNPATTTVDEHQVLIAFGDTFSIAPRSGVWRFNTLFRTPDDNLGNGLYVPNGVPVSAQVLPPNLAHFSGSPMERANWSDPILPSPGDPVHPPYAVGPEVTIIPTAGVSTPYNNAYGARQYMSFMSVRSWDTPGRWTTNYSGVAYSDDNGQTWTIAPTSIRSAAAGRAATPFVSGNQNFQQGAFVKPPAGSAEADQGWVYSYGTPSGRAGTLYLSRVQQDQILDTAKYQYWNGSSWVANNPSAAAPVLPVQSTSFFGFFKSTKAPSVSELSVQYNPYLKKYVMLYGDSSNRIVMRTADSPEGTWSAPKTLVGSWTLGGKYAPYIHPWSGTDELTDPGQYLYWNLSTWGNYQVRLMRTDLTKV